MCGTEAIEVDSEELSCIKVAIVIIIISASFHVNISLMKCPSTLAMSSLSDFLLSLGSERDSKHSSLHLKPRYLFTMYA